MSCNINKVLVITVAAILLATRINTQAEESDNPFEGIKTTKVPVTWEYSNDDGKTFTKTPHKGPPLGQHHEKRVFAYVWKGTFEVDDPSKIAGLWIRIVDDINKDTPKKASICNCDVDTAAGGYWKDLGFCPTLLNASIKLNDKEVEFANGPLLEFWMPLTGEVKKGANTVKLSGRVYTYWKGPIAESIDAVVVAAAPQPALAYNGPIIGDSGDGYFTLACRTQLPADLTVEATPVEPAGQAVTAVSKGKIWHRMKVEVPKGTRKLNYTVSAKVGEHVTKRGPYALTIMPGKEYRFIAFGNPQQHRAKEGDPWMKNSKLILKAEPAFVVNTGNLMEQEPWSFRWESSYTGPAAEMLASVSTLITPSEHDLSGNFNELHYTPAADGYSHNWTKVVGPVRFIGIDGNQQWAAGSANTKWLEGILQDAKDKFIVVLSGYPGYSSGINSKKLYPCLAQVRNVIMPLLGKYKATMVLSSWDPSYERIEPTPDKGVTQIITGVIGQKSWHKWDGNFGSHPFGPGNKADARGTQGNKGAGENEWVGYLSKRHFCVFDVKDNAIEMKVLACGEPETDIKDLKVLDQKIFKPRN